MYGPATGTYLSSLSLFCDPITCPLFTLSLVCTHGLFCGGVLVWLFIYRGLGAEYESGFALALPWIPVLWQAA